MKDSRDTTAAHAVLKVQFWQAGGELEEMDLGYTVAARDGLHMNSMHILSLAQRRVSTMAPGLVLEIWPEKNIKIDISSPDAVSRRTYHAQNFRLS